MKKNLIIIPTILVFLGCSSSENPEMVADKFLNAFNERNFEKAREVSTPETGKLIDLMQQITELSNNSDSTIGGKILIIDHHIDGETAVVRFREESSGETQEVPLKKVDGKWLVHITKQDIANKDMPGGTGGQDGMLLEPDSLGEVTADTLVY